MTTVLIISLLLSVLLATGCTPDNTQTEGTPSGNVSQAPPECQHDFADADCTIPKTCATCGVTEGDALGHDFADADCTIPKTCATCGVTEGDALGHDFADVDCTAPKTCKTCGTTDGEALGHDFSNADCTKPKTCKTCGVTEGEALGHDFANATCTTPKTCKACGATEGEALGHDFAEANCTTAKTCKTCGATEGEALGHDFSDANCTAPKTCKTCGTTEGEALDHDFSDANCTTPKTCKTCGAADGEALGHDFSDADCTAPKTCKTCGATEGEALGHDFADADCTKPKTCKACGATEGDLGAHDFEDATCLTPETCKLCGATGGKATGHDWKDATYTEPKTCINCGATLGAVLSKIIPDSKNLVVGLNNIPIANSSMTEDQLRDIVVKFMRLQLTFAYTPTFSTGTSYSYYIKNLYKAYDGKQSLSNLIIKFEEGKYYGGVPYMGNAAGNMYRWLPFYDQYTGEMDWTPIINSRRLDWVDSNSGRVYPDVGSALFGNSCSSSCFWAWGRVTNKIASCWTAGWLPKNGFVKVGNYVLANNDTAQGDETKDVCKANGTAVMYASYAAMKRADGLVQSGHAIMIVADPVVVYKADGSIDGDKSYVCVAEQKASFLTTSPTNGGVDLYSPLNDSGITYRIMGNYWGTIVNGRVKDMEWSFWELYDKGFLPFTAPELVGQDPVEKATASLSFTQSSITVAQLSASSTTVKSNYAISDVHFTVRDASGNETYIGMYAKAAGSLSGYRTYYMSEALKNNIIYSSTTHIKTELEKYAGLGYTLIITCRVSTGELLTVYTGTLK